MKFVTNTLIVYLISIYYQVNIMHKYIVLEWIHGSGKSAVAKKLAEKLQSKWINAKYFHFPNEEDLLWQYIRWVLTQEVLYKKWEITWLLYATASNVFHTQTLNDDTIYILDRHPVTTWLIFQRDIHLEVRLEIYKDGIKWLRENGKVFYVKVDRDIAFERLTTRNNELSTKDEVLKNKANDNFILQKFDELTSLYDDNLISQMQKLDLKSDVVDNSGTLEDTVQQILDKLNV